MDIKRAVGAGLFSMLLGASAFAQYEGKNLRDYYTIETAVSSVNEVARISRDDIHILKNKSLSDEELGTASRMTFNEALSFFDEIYNDDVVGMAALPKYESEIPSQKAGLCFGRALYTHYLARSRGIDDEAIRKVLLVGSVDSGATRIDDEGQVKSIIWKFHIATAIRGEGDTWWVFDFDKGELMNLDDWYSFYVTKDRDFKMRLYITEPHRFAPKIPIYDSTQLGLNLPRNQDFYRGYFTDALSKLGLLDYFLKVEKVYETPNALFGLPEKYLNLEPSRDRPASSNACVKILK